MISCCCGTRSPGISSRHNLRFQGLGIDARTLPPSKTFFEIYAKPPGTKIFSATPDSMRTREKSFNPLQIGSKLPLKCAKRKPSGRPVEAMAHAGTPAEGAASHRRRFHAGLYIGIPTVLFNSKPSGRSRGKPRPFRSYSALFKRWGVPGLFQPNGTSDDRSAHALQTHNERFYQPYDSGRRRANTAIR